jgi:peptidoglycan hydrolase CwlO-like protein
LLVSALALPPFLVGCSKTAPCTVSPIEIEETREDVKVAEKKLADAKARAEKLRKKLAEKQAELAKKKDLPEKLRKKLEELKKGSGRE